MAGSKISTVMSIVPCPPELVGAYSTFLPLWIDDIFPCLEDVGNETAGYFVILAGPGSGR